MKTIKVVAGIIIDSDKVLIARRGSKESFAGGWEFPGGKIEAGETPQEALIRELKEELDITISVGELCAEIVQNYGYISINLISYYCNIIDGKITMSAHDTYKWVGIKNLFKYKLLPADVKIANKILGKYFK